MYVTRELGRTVCLENEQLQRHTKSKSYSHKCVLTWYNRHIESDCQNDQLGANLDSKILIEFLYVCMSVCLWRSSGHKNYPIHLKFSPNIMCFFEISCTVFGVCCSNNKCMEIYKSISIFQYIAAYGGNIFVCNFSNFRLHHTWWNLQNFCHTLNEINNRIWY